MGRVRRRDHRADVERSHKVLPACRPRRAPLREPATETASSAETTRTPIRGREPATLRDRSRRTSPPEFAQLRNATTRRPARQRATSRSSCLPEPNHALPNRASSNPDQQKAKPVPAPFSRAAATRPASTPIATAHKKQARARPTRRTRRFAGSRTLWEEMGTPEFLPQRRRGRGD